MNPPRTLHRARQHQGSVLIEVSLGLGVATVLALMLMKASLLSVGSNQWTIMQTLTDAFMTRETALANRIPVADLTAPDSIWPDAGEDDPPRHEETVTLGRVAGRVEITGDLIRFRVNETGGEEDAPLAIWRLHSILTYHIGGKQYVKSRATLRTL
ncbi:MAG TPA: hypothetical protein DIT64_01405 [Verrucomicrobiales bacterium]|nr:hypothetical protein [Verrucomicrobiales bacterium]